MSERGFTLIGVAPTEVGDPLGLWDVPPAAVTFAAEGAEAGPTWRVELPASPEAARQRLAAHAQTLRWGRRDLERVEALLAAFDPTEAVTFDMREPLGEQRRALQETIAAFQQPVAYAATPPAAVRDETAYRQWREFVAWVRQLISHYVRVETLIAEQFVGCTEVSWTGDFATTWAPEVEQLAVTEHRQAVRQALASRIVWVRLVSVVTTGAASLALKASMPGGQLLLLPAVWRFVRDVLKELRKPRSTLRSPI
ncbi:MAG: hypothetical protein ACP5HM_09210 [Anaerolineae bacterium]